MSSITTQIIISALLHEQYKNAACTEHESIAVPKLTKRTLTLRETSANSVAPRGIKQFLYRTVPWGSQQKVAKRLLGSHCITDKV